MNTLETASVALHELYLSLQKAGFKRKEALYIIATMAGMANNDTEM